MTTTKYTSNIPIAQPIILLRLLSITSLISMFLTALVLMILYQQDQRSEHEDIFAQNGETSVIDLLHSLNDQIYAVIVTSNGLDIQAIRANLNIDSFFDAKEIFRRFGIFKVKLYNQSGVTVYSPSKSEIGETNSRPDMLAKALLGEVTHKLEFRETFFSAVGEKHNVYVALTFMPLTHEGKRIGAIEIYVDATSLITRINNKTIRIGLIVFLAFALQYASLFFYVRKTDRSAAVNRKSEVTLIGSSPQ